MFKRLFVFGCSYTSHSWPTWADIIARDLELPYENWGLGGLGNFGIQSRLVECDLKNKLNQDDLVLILWSGWNREDRFRLDKCGWICGGYIFNNHNYDKRFLEKYWTLENDIVRNITIFHTTRRAYSDIIKWEGEMTSPYYGDEYHHNQLNKSTNFITRLLNDFENRSPKIPKFPNYAANEWNTLHSDSHPDIKQHRDFVIKEIYSKLNLTMKQSTVDIINELYPKVIDICKNNQHVDSHVRNTLTRNLYKSHGFDLTVLNSQYSQA